MFRVLAGYKLALMLSVIIPTLDAERHLVRTLAALVPGAVEGVVREVIIADGGSRDRTLEIAREAGCEIVEGAAGRGAQLAAGSVAARGEWLMFLHADTELMPGWIGAVEAFTARQGPGRAAYFRFQLDDRGLRPALLQGLVRLRCVLFALPYGDQGLLIHRSLYDEIGGYRDMALMEDVDLVRRLGRRRLMPLPAAAVTSAERYRQAGYLPRMLRNALCLALYFCRVPVARIARIYGAGPDRA